MSTTLTDPKITNTLNQANKTHTITVKPKNLPKKEILKPFPSPLDWRDQLMYFIMVDRFNNPASQPNSTWNQSAERQGGNFEGIRQKLNYLENLGVGALWISPVLKNRQSPINQSHHGYGIMDFLEVDPRFGTSPEKAESELIKLIDEAHARQMYIILDIVINHAGDIFAYNVDGSPKDEVIWNNDAPYDIEWRDEKGTPNPQCHKLPDDLDHVTLKPNAAIWPSEFQHNEYFRRKGKSPAGNDIVGDFASLKEFQTDYTDIYHDKPVLNLLIKAYQYIIARFDVDGFRIDTLKHVERKNAQTFCNAIREYALSIGKKNFFIFGETKTDKEDVLAAYIGRNTSESDSVTGADAALDFPLQWTLTDIAKGFKPPVEIEKLFNHRKQIHREKHLLSTHGESSRFFVTFLDCHDDSSRFLYPKDGVDYNQQLTMTLGCLFCLQGIPCLYYGTEQGLKGCQELYQPDYDPKHSKPEYVREAFWGKPKAFDPTHPLYVETQKLIQLRQAEPALRYGRQYFRPVSDDNNKDFGLSRYTGGIIAFSRILNDREVVIVANTNLKDIFKGWVLIDSRINSAQSLFQVAYSNYQTAGSGYPSAGNVNMYNWQNTPSKSWATRLYVQLAPMELQILAQPKKEAEE